jgi:hypothetical protein
MGLDQYAYSREPAQIDHQWRKHPNLQGWMENLWRERFDVQTGDFCCEIELYKEDIERLKVDIMAGDLPATDGFFFGSNSDDYYREDDLAFCAWALIEIDKGREVYYDSSW